MLVTTRFTAVLGVALLIARCGSSSGLISQSVEGGPGQPISVSILGAESDQLGDRDGTRQYILQVEVSNNSDVPVTVTRISISATGASAFQIQPASQTFNEMIDPGKEHQFDIYISLTIAFSFWGAFPVAMMRYGVSSILGSFSV